MTTCHVICVFYTLQDTYVLHDNDFRLLSHISHSDQHKDQAALVRHMSSSYCCSCWDMVPIMNFLAEILTRGLLNTSLEVI